MKLFFTGFIQVLLICFNTYLIGNNKSMTVGAMTGTISGVLIGRVFFS